MKHRASHSLLLALTVCAGIPAALRAQSYSIDWHTVDGGGGTSTGGVYSVSGTIGQPDAGAMSGGTYALTGGFWALFAVQTPGAPILRIFLTSTNTAVVAWPAPSTGFILQQNGILNSTNWGTLTNSFVVDGENRVIISPPSGNRFFRLFKP